MDYQTTVDAVMSLLKEKKVCSSSRWSHKDCYDSLKEFAYQEQHATFKGRSGYFIVIRGFLQFLGEKGYTVHTALQHCLLSGSAPVEKLVDVLSDGQLKKIDEFRSSHQEPIELRDTAMVMLGLKMGFRASDVLDLKFRDVNWKNREISILMAKTKTQITLPMPVDVGNAIYAYLCNGRPISSDQHIFIRTKAPYGKLTGKVCTKALYRLLPEREAGFIYESEEWLLKHFDAFCFQRGISQPFLGKELVTEWGIWKDQEEMVTCSKRISVLRQFGFYMISLGKEAYIPRHFYKSVKRVVHILSDEEIVSVFKVIDEYRPSMSYEAFHRLAAEYKVIFRLLYCCGLRISEVRNLHTDDVDLDHGTLRIIQSKGRKDRIVYLSEDLAELLREYAFQLSSAFLCQSAWFFPARDPEKQLSNVTIDKRFRDSWAKTPFAKNCDRNPTVHCLRHSFVVKRMNLWMEEGVSLKEMLPFLSKFLGHTSPEETLYYYHQVDSAFRIIRSLDKTSAKVIPEVAIDE